MVPCQDLFATIRAFTHPRARGAELNAALGPFGKLQSLCDRVSRGWRGLQLKPSLLPVVCFAGQNGVDRVQGQVAL